ncbi:MAG: uracil-DNA glycosylase [Bacillus subtilis]|nr:uracil-DNA glycosylase [Bacillus subtilis]
MPYVIGALISGRGRGALHRRVTRANQKTDVPEGCETARKAPGCATCGSSGACAVRPKPKRMLNNDWDELLHAAFQEPAFVELVAKVKAEIRTVFLLSADQPCFQRLRLTSYEATRVVVLGQDPYHNPGEAMGLSFSVPDGVKLPPSLINIYAELQTDLGIAPSPSGDLSGWAKQGVLLLNAVLTVREHQPASHRTLGWQNFTDHILSLLNQKTTPVVFVLWGNSRPRETRPPHQSDSSRHRERASFATLGVPRFLWFKPFSRINRFLVSTGQRPIDFSFHG